ncbi:hypothetical protein [Actinomycetospora soli]|uniref:hypothetical protein n=1 Tax=Actinomycetospora soli TaxID=2893887 RepID=UPI001E3F5921|nr:hypothetical protein [Actinomycetospora soli]MCD2190959.1 hypothetical protein [Actinomycetospora soli]
MLLGTLPVEDGQTPPPAVGDVVRLTLRFAEADADAADAAVSVISARAEPVGDGSARSPGMRWDGTVDDRPPVWPTVLHGDGWSAMWSAPRPVIGQVVLRGTLIDNLDIGNHTGVRGRVLRAQVVTETIDNTDPDQRQWRPIPSAQRLRDVEVSPRWFDHGLVVPDDVPTGGWVSPVPGDPYVLERGVLLDLDLDDVPALAPRPRIVPGAVTAYGEDVWVADTRLPLVLRVRRPLDAHPEITEYPWPGRILDPGHGERRSLHADHDGAWITGPDGIYRIDHTDNGREDNDREGTVRLVDDGPAWVLAATNREALLTVLRLDPGDPHTPLVLRLITPNGDRRDTTLDDQSVAAATEAEDGAGFVLLLRHRDHPPGPDSPGRPTAGPGWAGSAPPATSSRAPTSTSATRACSNWSPATRRS